MKIIVVAMALAIAFPATAQTAPAAPRDHSQHQQAGHQQHGQGHSEHDGQHQHKQSEEHKHGCCADHDGNGRMDCCEQARKGEQRSCCKQQEGQPAGHSH